MFSSKKDRDKDDKRKRVTVRVVVPDDDVPEIVADSDDPASLESREQVLRIIREDRERRRREAGGLADEVDPYAGDYSDPQAHEPDWYPDEAPATQPPGAPRVGSRVARYFGLDYLVEGDDQQDPNRSGYCSFNGVSLFHGQHSLDGSNCILPSGRV